MIPPYMRFYAETRTKNMYMQNILKMYNIYFTYIVDNCIIKIYFFYKYEIYSHKYILHTSSYAAKYIFPNFSRRKVVYFIYLSVL